MRQALRRAWLWVRWGRHMQRVVARHAKPLFFLDVFGTPRTSSYRIAILCCTKCGATTALGDDQRVTMTGCPAVRAYTGRGVEFPQARVVAS